MPMFRRMRLLFGLLLFSCNLACIGPVFAEEIRDYYAEPALNPFKGTVNQHFNEHVDPFSGTLQLKYVDLSIPGNGGMDITSPANNASVVAGNIVTFTATSEDAEDGTLSSTINWSSDIDGPLGTGSTLNMSTLSLGTHTITARSTDSENAGKHTVVNVRTGTDMINAMSEYNKKNGGIDGLRVFSHSGNNGIYTDASSDAYLSLYSGGAGYWWSLVAPGARRIGAIEPEWFKEDATVQLFGCNTRTAKIRLPSCSPGISIAP